MVRRRALPLRIARRKMRADIARGDRAQQGIGKSMEHDIGVAVSRKPLVVRDQPAAQPQLLARDEPMNDEPERAPGPHCPCRARFGSETGRASWRARGGWNVWSPGGAG